MGMIWETTDSNRENLNLPLSHRRDTTESGMNLRIMGITGGGGNPTIQLAANSRFAIPIILVSL